MTAFVAEGARLGVFHTTDWQEQGRVLPNEINEADSEGLCITGCGSCRQFRNRVRAAMQQEADIEREQREVEAIRRAWQDWELTHQCPALTVDEATSFLFDYYHSKGMRVRIDIESMAQPLRY